MSDEHFDIKQGVELSLPTQSSLASTLKQSEVVRGVLDWLIISLCILGIYVFAKSQLDHEIELGTLPQKKVVKEAPSNAGTSKLEVFSWQRNSEQEIWADLKELLERKRPSNGHCQINTAESKKRRSASASGHRISEHKEFETEYELACWIQFNKKTPYPHKGTENLLDLNLLSKFKSDGYSKLPDNQSTQPSNQKAQIMSPNEEPIQAEGWIETVTGILRFDAKEQRWK